MEDAGVQAGCVFIILRISDRKVIVGQCVFKKHLIFINTCSHSVICGNVTDNKIRFLVGQRINLVDHS